MTTHQLGDGLIVHIWSTGRWKVYLDGKFRIGGQCNDEAQALLTARLAATIVEPHKCGGQ